MDRLVALHHQHQDNQVPPEIEAAWLHHRFTQIHPFQDGNGRVARCLASLVFIQAGWFPLVLTRDDRTAYIQASEQADHDDLSGLVNLFSKSQKQAFIRSLPPDGSKSHYHGCQIDVSESPTPTRNGDRADANRVIRVSIVVYFRR